MTETDKSHFLSLVRRSRERAEYARTLAETLRDPDARQMMFETAERYEKLARRLLEQRTPPSAALLGQSELNQELES